MASDFPTSIFSRHTHLALVLQASIFGTSLYTLPTWAADTPTQQASRYYDIAPGPLAEVLARFSSALGIALSFDSALTAGKHSSGLQGQYDTASGYNAILLGSGLEITVKEDGSYQLRKTSTPSPASSSKQPDQAGALPEVSVKASVVKDATTEGTGSYTARASTIGKTEQTLRSIPQSVSVITREQMNDRNVTSLIDVMQYATGISFYNNDGQGGGSFYARGYDGLQMQYDGVASNGGSGNIQANMALYDRVEVQRGPAGLLQGSGNPAGTINLVRKRGQSEFAIAGSFAAGSWDNYSGDIDVTGPLNADGSVRGRAILAAQDRKFFYDHADANSLMGHLSLDIDFTPSTTFGVAITSQRDKAAPFAGVLAYSNTKFPDWNRSTNLNAPWGHTETKLNEIVADLTHQLNDNWKIKAAMRYRESDMEYYTARPTSALSLATGTFSSLRYEQQATYSRYMATDVNLSGFFEAFGRRHEVLLGVNSDRSEYDYYYWAGTAPSSTGSFDPTNPGYDRALVPAAVPQNQYQIDQTGLYGMARLKVLDPLTIILGGRISNYDSQNRSIAAGSTRTWTQGAQAHHEFTPYAGTVWDFSKQLSWYASYADVFIPQTVVDYRGKALDPRIGWQIETGIKGEFFNGALNTTLSFFRIRDKNRSITDPDPTHVCPTSTGQCSMEGGLMQNQGWEVDISGSPLAGLELTAGYTRNDTKYLRDNNLSRVGITQPSTTINPRHMFKTWGNYKFSGSLQGWNVGGGAMSYSETESLTGLKQSGYTVFSLQTGYVINQHWHAMFTINNLFDKTYFRQMNSTSAFNYYGDPRSAMLNIRYKF